MRRSVVIGVSLLIATALCRPSLNDDHGHSHKGKIHDLLEKIEEMAHNIIKDDGTEPIKFDELKEAIKKAKDSAPDIKELWGKVSSSFEELDKSEDKKQEFKKTLNQLMEKIKPSMGKIGRLGMRLSMFGVKAKGRCVEKFEDVLDILHHKEVEDSVEEADKESSGKKPHKKLTVKEKADIKEHMKKGMGCIKKDMDELAKYLAEMDALKDDDREIEILMGVGKFVGGVTKITKDFHVLFHALNEIAEQEGQATIKKPVSTPPPVNQGKRELIEALKEYLKKYNLA